MLLNQVTLVMVETQCHKLAELAIKNCIEHINFESILICSDQKLNINSDYKWVKTPIFKNYDEYGIWSLKDVEEFIETDYALLIQYDSWIINPNLWDFKFLDYDYIGPPWWYKDGMNVGCGGFVIISKKFLNFIVNNMDKYPLKQPFDDTICRVNRPGYENEGFRFAPEDLALKFGFERSKFNGQHFGFHGMFNWPKVLSWEGLVERCSHCTPYHLKPDGLTEIFLHIGKDRKRQLIKEAELKFVVDI